jgi:diacylglycerol kinase (ATP)
MPAAVVHFFVVCIDMDKTLDVQLLHNPGAGAQSFTKEQLLSMVQDEGWNCRYSSTKEDWELDPTADIIVIAGGDGTVKKAVKQVLKNNKRPKLAVLPLGTANNIAHSLGTTGDVRTVLHSIQNGDSKPRKFDVGTIKGIPDIHFFIEGIGFGVFPEAVKKILNSNAPPSATPEESMQKTLKVIHETILSYKPDYCYMEVDGNIYSGMFLMLEIMNIRSVGPRLFIAPAADTGDGQLDIMMAREHEKEKLAEYIRNKIVRDEDISLLQTIRGKHISLQWYGTELHADDKLVSLQPSAELKIFIEEGALEFFANTKQP